MTVALTDTYIAETKFLQKTNLNIQITFFP
jgi:hypothetical protein